MPHPRPNSTDASIPSKRRRGVGAGLSGAVAGTGITYLVQLLPENSPYKNSLLLAIPSVSVALSVAALFCYKEIVATWLKYKETSEKEEFLRLAEERLHDANATPEHKNEVRLKLEAFQTSELDRSLNRVKSLQEVRAKVERSNANA